jgi:hypothetical protein
MGFRLTDDMFGSQDQPGFLVLQDADRFHCIFRSEEIVLEDSTMILVIFVVRRAESGLFDLFILNKFFRQDGTTTKSTMSKKDIPATEIEQTISTTSSTFSSVLRPHGKKLDWQELDLRAVPAKDEQIRLINEWGIGRAR